MAHLGCLLLLFLGLCSFCSSVTCEFHVVKEKKTWADAQQYCRKEFIDLATIDTETEMQKVKSLILNSSAAPAWFGLRNLNGQSTGVWKWSDGSNSSFSYWKSGEPNFGSSEHDFCAEITESAEWNDARCDHKNNFICYKASTFVLVDENKTWEDALQHCRKHYVDLASVPSEQIQHLVAEQAKKASTAQVWLGLRYFCALDVWFWVGGETVCYSNWASENDRGQGCVTSGGAVESKGHRGGQWVSLPVTKELNFICITEYR